MGTEGSRKGGKIKIPKTHFKLMSDVPGDSAEPDWICFMFY